MRQPQLAVIYFSYTVGSSSSPPLSSSRKRTTERVNNPPSGPSKPPQGSLGCHLKPTRGARATSAETSRGGNTPPLPPTSNASSETNGRQDITEAHVPPRTCQPVTTLLAADGGASWALLGPDRGKPRYWTFVGPQGKWGAASAVQEDALSPRRRCSAWPAFWQGLHLALRVPTRSARAGWCRCPPQTRRHGQTKA